MFDFNFEFHNPYWLLLFLVFIPLFLLRRSNVEKSIVVPATQGMTQSTSAIWIKQFLHFTKYMVLAFLILAMARPRTFTVSQNEDPEKGIDILLAVDVSLSMLSRDLEPDRLSALQRIAVDFVKQRTGDRIGLVTYSGEALTKVPVTTDHQVLIEEIQSINPLELSPGTAIGEGLGVAVSHLRTSTSKSKVIVLMTDGVNTIENAMPAQTAAELAASMGIKVYTIGIGTNGLALMPTNVDLFGDLVFTETEVQIDEPALLDIARTTGGNYFRATSNSTLQQVYQEINQLEKSQINSSKMYNYKEFYIFLLWAALALLVLDAFFRWWIYKFIT